jgi:hypothetical protein
MTHIDLFIQLIAEHGKISTEEAKFIFEEFRHEFPGPAYLDRELTEAEAPEMLNLYRNNQDLLQWISQVVVQHSRRPLPSA